MRVPHIEELSGVADYMIDPQMLLGPVLMSYQFPHKLEWNTIFDMSSFCIYMRVRLFNFWKI